MKRNASSAIGMTPETSLLELIIQTAPDAIITADAEGKILSFSPAAERMFGFTEDEVVGRNLACLMPEPYRSQHDGFIRRYLESGEKHVIGIGREVRARRKSGEIFVAELAVGELVLDDRHVFTGFVRDASDRAEAETRARELQRRLDRVTRMQMLGEMSSALAHEINQPLAAITNFARAAQRTLAGPAPDLALLSRQVEAIAEQSLRTGEIIRRMRRMIDRGKAEIRADNINDIIEEAVRVGRATSEHHGPKIELDLAADLPPVLADRIQIEQVLINLINNAFDALSDEDQPLRICSELAQADERILLRAGVNASEVMISVLDTGPGIPDEMMSTIFEPLVSNKRTGIGIGLAISRAIVEAHGGRIWAENGPEGAEFHFTLPIAR